MTSPTGISNQSAIVRNFYTDDAMILGMYATRSRKHSWCKFAVWSRCDAQSSALSQSEKREHSRCSQPGILHTDYPHVGESAYPDQGEARRHHQNQRLVQRTPIAEQASSMNHSGESAQSSRIHKKDVRLVRYCTRRR